MRVTLVSHASVIIETGNIVLWTDPWLFGRAFNESWALQPEVPRERIEAWLPRITHLWVSHEHPDHFHVPTLRWLPDDFKQRVPVLFQRLHTDKMPSAFRRFGFREVVTLRHREYLDLEDGVRFYLYQEAPLDSGCAIRDAEGRVLLNVNDCEPSRIDRRWMRKDLGHVDVLLNQYSIATYDGRTEIEAIAPKHAENVLDRMVLDHRGVDAKVSIPFASFMFFCKQDNAHLNAYRNSVQETQDRFDREGLELVVLRPYDTYVVGESHDNGPALEYYRNLAATRLDIDPLESVSVEDIEAAGSRLFEDLTKHYPTPLLRRIGRLRFSVPDLGRQYVLDFNESRMESFDNDTGDWDLQLNSQPFLFALQQPYGFQTLSVSGRFWIRRHERRFMLLRVVTALSNSEIYLRLRYMLSKPFVAFVLRNFPALATQFVSKLRLINRFVS